MKSRENRYEEEAKEKRTVRTGQLVDSGISLSSRKIGQIVILPKESEIINLHNEIIKEIGGKPGMRDIGGTILNSAVARARSMGTDAFDKAAIIAESVARFCPFVSNNKGTAFLIAILILRWNRIPTPPIDNEQPIVSLAMGGTLWRDFADWLKGICGRTKPTGNV